jgi:hypothetical protein
VVSVAVAADPTGPDGADHLDADPVVQVGVDEQRAAQHGIPQPVEDPDGPVHLQIADGEVAVVHLALGEQVAGHVELRVVAAAGTRFEAKGAEAVDAAGCLEALQQHSGFRYTCRGHDDVFETFDAMGLRHVALTVRGAGPVTIESVRVREHHFARFTATARRDVATARSAAAAGASPAGSRPDVPWFACSDPRLDDIWRIGRRTVDLCSQDAYLDCSSREQRGWTGDSVVHQLVDLTTNTDWSLARHNVVLGAAPRPDGMLPMAAAATSPGTTPR